MLPIHNYVSLLVLFKKIKLSIMKRNYIINLAYTLIFIIITTYLNAQTIPSMQPIGSANIENAAYVACVKTSTVGNALYAAGSFTGQGGVPCNNIAKWNGTSWSALGSGILGSLVTVNSLETWNGNLYAGGSFTNAGGVNANNIAKWNGTSWSALGSGVNISVLGMTVFNNALYVVGTFTNAGGVPCNNIAKWNGTTWSALGSGLSSYAKCVTVYNGELVVAGSFTNAGGVSVNGIAKWNGTSWSALGSGVSGSNVNCMIVYQNELYTGGPPSINKWDGSSWTSPFGVYNFVGTTGPVFVNCLHVFNNLLWIGGQFTAIKNPSGSQMKRVYQNICRVSGGNIILQECGVTDGWVNSLTDWNGLLIAGGKFLDNDYLGYSLNHIGQCNTGVGIEEYQLVNHVSISPNPSNGQFYFQGLVGENTIQIMDITGRILFVEKTSSENHSINLNASQGMYFYKISDKQNRVQQGRLILE